jgi:hypothetical protein
MAEATRAPESEPPAGATLRRDLMLEQPSRPADWTAPSLGWAVPSHPLGARPRETRPCETRPGILLLHSMLAM